MAITLESTQSRKGSRRIKSLLDLILERKERKQNYTLRPWQNFGDEVECQEEGAKKNSNIMRPYEESEDWRRALERQMARKIAERAKFLFDKIDY